MAVDPARAKSLFLKASDLASPAERAAYLNRECGGEAELRSRVEALLAAHDGGSRLREPSATGVSDPELAATQEMTRASVVMSPASDGDITLRVMERHAERDDDLGSEVVTGERRPDGNVPTIAGTPTASSPSGFIPGLVIGGRYTLCEVLGEGGMGTVYRAEQAQPVKRQVALKLIKTGMDSRTVLARFDAERQALALMDHPNIARVYDGGATEANQPFFVMELVHGISITEYCDQHRLPVRARLELFASVCQAVQHAHQKGIIHRDLTPGNLLVTEVDGRPTPKVIDFGVAKATEFNLTDKSLADTGVIVGTPAYMSPEQADPSSMDIDTRTDIYALGGILYELLAGSPPLDLSQFKRGAFLEMLRIVREVDPPRPSTRVSTSDALPNIAASRDSDPEHLKRALQGDLDWIVMKALEKDRTRRYATANGFAADVVRHLNHEPVLAAPPSRAYRMRKFVRRHRGGVIAASLVLLALLTGIAGTTWGLFEARRQEHEARLATHTALASALAEKQAKKTAEAAQESAEAAQEAGRKLLYTTDMQLAPFVWNDDRSTAEQLRVLLARHIPDRKAAGNKGVSAALKPDLRGFEWHYYQHLLEHSAAVFTGHSAYVIDGAFTSDGQLVTLDYHGQVRRWDLDSQVEEEASRRDLPGGPGAVAHVLSPNGRLAALDGGNTVHVFDTSTVKETFRVDSANSRKHYLIFSKDSDRLVIVDDRIGVDDRIRWLSAASGEMIASVDQKLPQFHGQTRLALSADGLTLAVVGLGPGADLFSLFRLDATRRSVTSVVKEVDAHTTLCSSALSPDGKWIAIGGRLSGTLSVYDTATGRRLAQHGSAHASFVSALAFSDDGAKLATADAQGTIKIWADARKLNEKSKALLTLKGHQGTITIVGFSIDARRLVSTSADQTARVWDLENAGAAIRRLERSGKCLVARFSPDGQLIATADGSGVRLRDAATGRIVRVLSTGDKSRVHSVAFSPTDHRLLAVGYGGQPGISHVGLWDIDASTELARLPGAIDLPGFLVDASHGAVAALAFSPDGKYLVAGFGTKTSITSINSPSPLKVWEVSTRQLIHRLDGHTGVCMSLDFSRDGKLLASGSRDGTVILWSTETWNRAQTLQNPDQSTVQIAGLGGDDTQAGRRRVDDAAFSPDGKTLAMASRAGNVQLWDVATGRLLETLKGHSSRVLAVVFSPDGRTLASGGDDQTVRLWNVQTRRQLMQLDAGSVEPGPVNSLAFSPDGTQLLAGGDRPAFWSAAPVLWSDSDRAAKTLRLLLQSNADFRSRIRMFSENLRLHEALEKLDATDVRVQAALAATQANWHASRQAWPEAALAYDRLVAADPTEPEAWLRTPGILRLATALLHQDRPADAARLSQAGAKRRTEDDLPAMSAEIGDRYAAEHDGERAIAEYRKRVTDQPADGALVTKLANAYQAAGRTREAVPYLAALSAANPKDTTLSLKVAALQAWFGQDKELAETCQRGLALAKDTNDLMMADRVAKICSLRGSDDKRHEAALVLARRAVDLGKGDRYLPFFQMALGMAEYRSGHFVLADAALTAAMDRGKGYRDVAGTSAFYRAMSLFRQGKLDGARALARAAAADMKPLPADEQNPLAGDVTHDDLILWLAYKEAKALIQFDAAPTAGAPHDVK